MAVNSYRELVASMFRLTKILRIQALALAATMALTGCLATPPSAVPKLARLNPMEADPADLRIAVRAPDTLALRTGDIKLRIAFDGGSDATRLIEEYGAVIVSGADGAPGVPVQAGDGTRVFTAALSPEDAAGLAETQRRIRTWRANGIEGKGSLSVSATGCAVRPFPPGPIYIATYLQTSPADDFFAVTRRIDLRRVLARSDVDADAIPACAAN